MWQAMAAQWIQDQPEAGYWVMLCVCEHVSVCVCVGMAANQQELFKIKMHEPRNQKQ